MQTSLRHRWPEIRALFEAALNRPRATREAYVAAQAATDPPLCAAVLALLRTEAAADGSTLAEDSSPPAVGIEANLPALLGNYRLLRPLGRGGMGVVWLAEQAQPQRLIALKLIAGEADAVALSRFQREASALARLAHPGIAQVYEAGAAEGRPFLAMEYVEGQPLTSAVAGLDRRERLALLVRIAEAVDHAHARGVVHRDLKPSNILVTSEGHPKVLDFGIAALSSAGGEALTATGTLLGTPAYMSPEQAAGLAGNDPRIDVYALGVIGYELLCDRLPVPVAGLGPLEALRALGEQTPPPLGRIDLSLRGDLETVIGQALAREPALRYPSAGALADDLRRFLAHEPVRARTPGRWHRLMLFGKRNPALLGLGLASFALLLAGLMVSLWFALGQSRERVRAEAALSQSQATLDALQQVFSAGNPVLAGQPDVSFRTVLNSAIEQLADAPIAVQASVGYALAEALAGLGETSAALKHFERVGKLADDRLRLRAGLRRIELLIENEAPHLAEAALAQMFADPKIHADPLVEVGLLILRARAFASVGRMRSFRRDFAAADARWPPPIEARDQRLAAELEAQLWLVRSMSVEYLADDSRALSALAPHLKAAVKRITPILGPEHPWVIELRVYDQMVQEYAAQTAHWAPVLAAEVDRRLPALGASHPAIMRRVWAGLWLAPSSYDNAAHLRLLKQALQVIRALPLQSRWRLRLAGLLARDNWTRGLDGMLGLDEFQAMAEAHCGPARPLDCDCALLAGAITPRLQAAGRSDEAIAQLRAMLARAEADIATGSGPTVRQMLLQSLTAALRGADAPDAAADVNDQVIAAINSDPELGTEERALRILSAVWDYRPDHCERALAQLRPVLTVLNRIGTGAPDVLARLLSTCEVRAGEDPRVALARLDQQWRNAQQLPADSTVRLELVIAYLEIHDVLHDDVAFARWSTELQKLEQAGVSISQLLTGRHPWVQRAWKLYTPASR